jgi:hypothetical protein
MSNNPRVKVVGYAKRDLFGNGIEYRNFSPDLVGLQIASEGGTPLFTMGNFNITTNMDPKSDKFFITNKFSNFVSLTDLDLSLANANKLLSDNAGVLLNLDKTNLKYNAQFGSLSEFVRVSLENIIINWPASLYVNNLALDVNNYSILGNTYDNYIYDYLSDTAFFRVNTTFINNKYQLNILKNGSILDTFNASNDLRNVTVNYAAYAVLLNGNEYPVLNFTAATHSTNDYVYFSVKGNPFSGISTSNISYHIKPNKIKEETFFNELPDFEAYLLNRLITPKYTAKFNYSVKSDDGVVLYTSDSVIWPTSDGYNIDFDTSGYIDYVTKLLDITTNNDLSTSDLMNRVLVSDSISSFDTAPINIYDLDRDSTGQKVTKTLRIYGRSFDDINNFIDGISFANTVSYNKLDNIPDIYIKNLARVLGWELMTSVVENGLLSNYVTTSKSSYEGQSVGLTPVEADIELWRRLILNSPWLWKSKGTRKSIEFLLKFIGVPGGLVTFNEYIYKAEAPIDIDLFKLALDLNGLDNTDLSIYPIDGNGYPYPLANSDTLYYQNYGLWFRETGGLNSTQDILTGNNPHLGPYDGGFAYINQFKGLIPNFSAVTLTSETITTGTTALFTNYDIGTITNYTGPIHVDVMNDDGSDIDKCVVVTSKIIPDPMPQALINECGCGHTEDDDVLSMCIKINEAEPPQICKDMVYPPKDIGVGYSYFQYFTYNANGGIFYDNNNNPIVNGSIYTTKECCKANGGFPTIYSTMNGNKVKNTGYVCCQTNRVDGICGCNVACQWSLIFDPLLLDGVNYLQFQKEDNSLGIVTPDGSHCPHAGYTDLAPNIKDPYTGEIGFACRLSQKGLEDLARGDYGLMNIWIKNKKNGDVDCCDKLTFTKSLYE